MKILHVTPTYWPAVRYGGPIVSTRALVAAQARAGHEVTVLTTSVDGSEDLRELEGAPRELDGATIHYFPCGAPRRLYRAPALREWLTTRVASFDVVHAHAAFLWPAWHAGVSAARARRAFVYSPRGMLVPELIAARSAWIKRAWIASFERGTLRRCDALHFTSRWEADAFARLGLRHRGRAVVVNNGIDPPGAPLAVTRDPAHIVYLGRLSWEKRVQVLVEAAARAPGIRVTIAGADAGDGHGEHLRAMAARLGVSARVTLVGALDNEAKRVLLASASVLVLPSVSESFGNVVVEAMAEGCAVLIAPGVGARDVVEQADAGAVVEAEPEAIARVLGEWLADPQSLRARGERGRAYVREHLTWDCIARQFDAVYAQARDHTGAGHA